MEALIVLCMNSIFHEVQNLSRPIIWSAIQSTICSCAYEVLLGLLLPY